VRLERAPETASDDRRGESFPRRVLRRLHRRDEGVALVEFALVLPMLVLLLFGIVDFGRALSYWLDEKHLAHETARFAAVARNPGAGAGTSLQRYVHDQAETSEMRDGGTDSVPSPGLRVCIIFPSGTSNVGDPVKVTTTVRFHWLQALGLDATETTLTASSTQRIEVAPGTAYTPSCYE
jgi:Flp pilus assembly protein TadG